MSISSWDEGFCRLLIDIVFSPCDFNEKRLLSRLGIMRWRGRGNLYPVEQMKWHHIWRLKLAREVTGEVFQRAIVARFVALNQARADQ
jgi:hypothetical protein